jgi:hypothetical protein
MKGQIVIIEKNLKYVAYGTRPKINVEMQNP